MPRTNEARSTRRPRLIVRCTVIVLTGLLGIMLNGCSTTGVGTARNDPAPSDETDDSVLAKAFADRATGVEVQGSGKVSRLLSDDHEGARHQRFIVTLGSGQTVLVSHNIDVSPRITALRVGDTVSFKGEYEWNDQGGIIHWTHHDPLGSHEAGWIAHEGRTYE